MCGISGFYDSRGSAETLERMLETTTHRGPDYGGTWLGLPAGFAHNRLSIIDLSEKAHQPMHYGQVVICLNGEIYNYIELREELLEKGYSFNSDSDTEVAAAAYLHWGEECVKHFIGMWAFAIWDARQGSLFCSRDRFGIKPFHYIHQGDRFYFASEYKPLKKSPLFDGKLNEAQVARGLQLGWAFFGEESYYQCIKRLPPAHNLRFDGEKLSIYRYWDIEPGHQTTAPREVRFEQFRSLFADSVKLQMRSDVRVGSCLSGGIDSSAITSMISTLYPELPIDTFTIFYDGKNEVDERPWVNEVLKKYPNIRPHFYQPKDTELPDAFEKAQHFADVPLSGSSFISQYFVMRMAAAEGVTVLLDGQGSDEYLGGYMHSFDRLVGDMLRNFRLLKAAQTLLQHRSRHGQSLSGLAYSASKSLLSAVNNENNFYRYAYKYKFPMVCRNAGQEVPFTLDTLAGAGRFDEFSYHLVFNTSLPTLLLFEDRNSMAFSIESRVPFLDHRLVELAFTLPDEDKINHGETKHILRHSLKGILPDAIIARQDKKGFVTPGEDKWLRGPLKHLLEIDFGNYDFIDNAKVKKIVADYRNGRSNSTLIWRLAALNQWLKNI